MAAPTAEDLEKHRVLRQIYGDKAVPNYKRKSKEDGEDSTSSRLSDRVAFQKDADISWVVDEIATGEFHLTKRKGSDAITILNWFLKGSHSNNFLYFNLVGRNKPSEEIQRSSLLYLPEQNINLKKEIATYRSLSDRLCNLFDMYREEYKWTFFSRDVEWSKNFIIHYQNKLSYAVINVRKLNENNGNGRFDSERVLFLPTYKKRKFKQK